MIDLEEFKTAAWVWLEWYHRAWSLVWSRYIVPTALRLMAYFGSINVPDDTKMAVLVGLGLGVVAVAVNLMYPGEPYSYSAGSYINEKGENISKAKAKKVAAKQKKQQQEQGGTTAGEGEQTKKKKSFWDTDSEGEEEGAGDGKGSSGDGAGELAVATKETGEGEAVAAAETASSSSSKKKKKKNKKNKKKSPEEEGEAESEGGEGRGAAEAEAEGVSSASSSSSSKGQLQLNLTDGLPEVGEDSQGDQADPSVDPFADPDVERRARRAASYFGLNEEQYQTALANAKEEYRTGVPPKGAGSDAAEWAGVVNYGLLAGLFAALLWSINHDYNNAFTKWFVVHFPDEARTMGIEFPVD
jgi:hypothetical protein